MAPLLARASRARGLAFEAPVQAFAVPEGEVRGLLARETDRVTSRKEFRGASALLEALGLAPAGFDLRESLLVLEAGSLAGFYSPVEDRLYVVVDRGRGGVREAITARAPVLVHELGHALQAQHSRLLEAAVGIVSEQDLLFALGAMLEGDALYTEMRDAELQDGLVMPSAGAFAEAFDAQQSKVGRGVPRFVRESVLLAYPTGYRLARALADRGGTAALDAALADPPLSSAELLHPERYLDAARRAPLRTLEAEVVRFAPEPDCSDAADASLGELGLRAFAEAAGLAPAEAADLASGWDADHAWLLDCRGRRVVAWLVELASPARAGELAAALARARGRAGPGAPPALVLERRDRRLLLSAGLDPAGRRFLTERLAPHRYADLEAWLRAHPQVLERARRIRAAARRASR